MTEPATIALALLLLVNICWCVALHRRLALLDEDGERLREFLRAFDEAVEKARSAASGLREEAAGIEKDLRRHAEGARLRGEQLARLCEGGERLARRLEAALERAAGVRAAIASHEEDRRSPARAGPPRPEAAATAVRDPAEPGGIAAAGAARTATRPADLERLLARLR